MAAEIIDGKEIAKKLRTELKEKVAAMEQKPGLAVVRVGEDPASQLYVNMKEKACEQIGFYSEKHVLDEEVPEEDLLKLIDQLNNSDKIHGILVQLPLPAHISEDKVLNSIDPKKDVDGFHPMNMGKLLAAKKDIPTDIPIACTPKGCIKLIESTGTEISGKHAVVVGRSNIVGKPVALLLLQKNATVTVCHSRTEDLSQECQKADILVAAVGSPGMITKDMIKPGAVVIDVASPKGDVDFEAAKEVASYITPVPGGVGPMTIACLMENTFEASKNQ